MTATKQLIEMCPITNLVHEFLYSPAQVSCSSAAALAACVIPYCATPPLFKFKLDFTMSEPVSFSRFVCCSYYDKGDVSAFFGTHRVAALHISRSRACQAASKGVGFVPVVYRDSQTDPEVGGPRSRSPWRAGTLASASGGQRRHSR